MCASVLKPLSRLVLAAAAASAAAAAAAGPPRYVIETVAGTDDPGDGGPALAAQLGLPQGIAADRRGNLYVADTENHRVRMIEPAGTIRTVAGNGYPGMRGDGGPGVYAQLNQPFGIAVDPDGNLYIADLGNHRVRRVSAAGIITTVAGTGEMGSQGDGGPAAAAQLMSPRNVTLDAAGNLYISEFEGHRVRKVGLDGIITTVAGIGVAGLAGDGGPARRAQLAFPAGLLVDASGSLFVADSQNHRIRRIFPDGTISTWLGGTDNVVFQTPVGLALDAAGRLYVAERIPAIRRFSPGGQIDVVAGSNMPGYDGDGRPASTSLLLAPGDVATDASGNLYIADGQRVRRVGSNGILWTVAGDAYTSAIGDGGPAARAQFNRPAGLAMDAGGNLYVADSGTHRVRKLTPGGTISTAAGMGVRGYSGDGRAPEAAQLSAPAGVALDGAGNLLIADTGSNRIRQVVGPLIRTLAGSGGAGLGADGAPALAMPLHGPMAAVADLRSQAVYIADTLAHRVLLLGPGGTLSALAGNASGGFSGDGGRAATAQLREPSGLAVDAAGNLFIADAKNHRIRKVSPDGVIATVAGSGTEGYTGDGGPAASARLALPRGVAVDGDGNLYIADTGNHAVRMVKADGTIHTIAGKGAAGWGGDGGPATEALLNNPLAVLVDGSGNVYVSDSLNRRVRRLRPSAEPPPAEMTDEARVLNAASLAPGPVAPGEMVSIFAPGIGPQAAETGALGANGRMRTELAGTEVLFDGVPAPLFYAQGGQVNAQVPYGVAGRSQTAVEVRRYRETRARAVLPIVQAAPGLFTASGGTGQALAINEDGTFNSVANPAPRGSVVVLFATGEGQRDPAGTDGAPAEPPYARPALPVGITIGRYEAELRYAGAAPGLAGLMQINVRVPAGFVPTGDLAVELTVGGARSQPGVTLAVR